MTIHHRSGCQFHQGPPLQKSTRCVDDVAAVLAVVAVVVELGVVAVVAVVVVTGTVAVAVAAKSDTALVGLEFDAAAGVGNESDGADADADLDADLDTDPGVDFVALSLTGMDMVLVGANERQATGPADWDRRAKVVVAEGADIQNSRYEVDILRLVSRECRTNILETIVADKVSASVGPEAR